jgi:membrane associated rhomboid family serine protease
MFPIRDHNPSGRIPYVTYALIVANVLIFLSNWHLQSDPRAQLNFYASYALVPSFVTQGFGFEGFVTSLFLHGGVMHLAGNMLFLFIFGDNIEDELGHVRFVLFYFAAGVGAGVAHYLSGPLSNVPTIGASGAIAGVMGGYLLLFPKARVDILLFLIVFIRVFPVPAWLVLMMWFGMQVFGGLGSDPNSGGVAYWAHAGGFVIGLLLILPLWLRHGGPDFWRLSQGAPPHPEARYPRSVTQIPRIPRR